MRQSGQQRAHAMGDLQLEKAILGKMLDGLLLWERRIYAQLTIGWNVGNYAAVAEACRYYWPRYREPRYCDRFSERYVEDRVHAGRRRLEKALRQHGRLGPAEMGLHA